MAQSVPRFESWVDHSDVAALAESLHDPPSARARRQEALEAFLQLPLEPNPLYRKYGYFGGVDLSGIRPAEVGPGVEMPVDHPDSILAIHDASGTRLRVPPRLVAAGVLGQTIGELWQGPPTEASSFAFGAARPEDRLTALGATLVNRGYRLSVPDQCPLPVRVDDISILSTSDEAISIRRVIQLGANTRLLFGEETLSTDAQSERQRFLGSSTHIDLGERASAAYLTVHAADQKAVGVFDRSAILGPSADLNWIWAGLGGFRTRARNDSRLVGNGSKLTDLQTFFGTGPQSFDSGVTITHLGTDTQGQSITRGVFRDESRGMSRGLVRIEKDARKTLSFLSEHAMLLSRGARSDTIPILEILCRDVKATHSTSVAPVDPERVFYLESRGFPADEAVRLIGEGFLAHVLEKAPVEGLRDTLYPMLAARWENRPIHWGGNGSWLLPPLEYSGESAGTEWRFDQKLR